MKYMFHFFKNLPKIFGRNRLSAILLMLFLLGSGCAKIPDLKNETKSNTTFPTPLLYEKTASSVKYYYFDYANDKKRVDLDFAASLPEGYVMNPYYESFTYDRKLNIAVFIAKNNGKQSIWKYDFDTRKTEPLCIGKICEFNNPKFSTNVYVEDIQDGRATFTLPGEENRGWYHAVDLETGKEVSKINTGSIAGAISGIGTQGMLIEWPTKTDRHFAYIETVQTSNKYSKFQYKGDEKKRQLQLFRVFIYNEGTGEKITNYWNVGSWEDFEQVLKSVVDDKKFAGDFLIDEVPETLRGIPQRKEVLIDEIWAINENTLAVAVHTGTLLISFDTQKIEYRSNTRPNEIPNTRYIGESNGDHLWTRCPEDQVREIYDMNLNIAGCLR